MLSCCRSTLSHFYNSAHHGNPFFWYFLYNVHDNKKLYAKKKLYANIKKQRYIDTGDKKVIAQMIVFVNISDIYNRPILKLLFSILC